MLNFKTPKEMEEILLKIGIDLYCPETGYYLFNYSEEKKAFALYKIDNKEAKELAQKAREDESYWGAFLGPGGWVYENEDCDEFFKQHYQDNWEAADEY